MNNQETPVITRKMNIDRRIEMSKIKLYIKSLEFMHDTLTLEKGKVFCQTKHNEDIFDLYKDYYTK